ncbi:MAG: Omp28-related outer membrane protein, partial [Bacteroidales bacterium]|nr:Omp28-related outer membrane protein [Bacteroidales bacterium]
SLAGYPAGTVNRHLFPGLSQNTTSPGTAMSRGNWTNASNQIMAQASYVNVAATATVDVTTRLMTVYVELYYTGNGPAQNLLSVALLQNNVIGPKVGASLNPSYVVPPSSYKHMHMLRHLLTGQWGDPIIKTAAGTFTTRTYTYTLPTHITNVELALGNLEVMAFVAEGQQVIMTGAEAAITYTNFIFVHDVSIGIKQAEQFFIYPNPANDVLYVAGGERYNTLQIFNVVGQLAKTVGNFSSQKGQDGIYVGDLARGVYIVKLYGDDRETFTRLVISK